MTMDRKEYLDLLAQIEEIEGGINEAFADSPHLEELQTKLAYLKTFAEINYCRENCGDELCATSGACGGDGGDGEDDAYQVEEVDDEGDIPF
jgi:hypothetical protein